MNISILGCGWLGLPLAEQLRDNGHLIKGSTTSPEKLELLKGKDITPFLLQLNPDLDCEDCGDFWNSNLLILNIPPGRGRDNVEKYHLHQIQAIIDRVQESPIEWVIFVSSTSVYPEKPGIVNEEDTISGQARRSSGNALLKAEQLLQSQKEFDTTIVRFGGLYGYDRHPAKYLAGRENISAGDAPVNLIHRDDCIGIICAIIEQGVRNQVFNGVSDGHPPKKVYYRAAAEALGLTAPTFNAESSGRKEDFKVVSNRKVKHLLDYKFKYPNPMDFSGS